MKRITKIILLIVGISFGNTYCKGSNSASSKIYREANMAYQKLDYELSVRLYEQILKGKAVSPEVFYNLGNAYFKTGNTPKAILNYERALRINPDDEDASFNLKMASLKVVDKIENVPEIFYKKWINRIASSMPSGTWTVMLIMLIWIMFAVAALYVTASNVSRKKISFVVLVIVLLLSGVTTLLAAKSHAVSNVDEYAIIMSSSVYIKSSPADSGNDLFILHEGTKVQLLDELNEWKKIRIANGSVGWLKVTEIEKI